MNTGTDLVDIGNIETTVTFPSDATPHFWMSFIVPDNIYPLAIINNIIMYHFCRLPQSVQDIKLDPTT